MQDRISEIKAREAAATPTFDGCSPLLIGAFLYCLDLLSCKAEGQQRHADRLKLLIDFWFKAKREGEDPYEVAINILKK